ncbi:MAG: TIGR01212 family radical SAM protein [Clostridia bacterium]|nr:TIGR01212 family radical SAM protein [Clostridia bacterium]MBR0537029.1 TIGR01212 family radical SAM protein [Clostridia bacterium]
MEYYSMNDYCRETFGKKLYKLSLDGGFTCPNRDGTCGVGGCIFCSAGGSGEFTGRGATLGEQIEDAKRRVAAKHKNGGYIAYFQSYTGTYAPIGRLRALYTEVISRDDIDVLSIATRPDCLGPEVLALLRELNDKKPVWIELGLQTTKEESVRFIRRGYGTPVYDRAVRDLKKAGIYVITHVILGLPGETEEDMRETLLHAVGAGTDGVKLQLLHVLKDSDLYPLWLAGEVPTLSMEEYLDLLRFLVPHIPPTVAVHRLTGDGDKRTLAAPMWSADKKRVLNAIGKL